MHEPRDPPLEVVTFSILVTNITNIGNYKYVNDTWLVAQVGPIEII